MKTKYNPLQKRKQKGVALILGTLFFIVLLGFMAIMLDFGRGYLAVHELHNSADSAALIGARYVSIIYDPNTGTTDPYIAKSIAAEYGHKHFAASQLVFMSTDTTVDPADYIDADGEGIPLDPYDDTLEDDLYIGRYVEHSDLFFVDHENPDSMLAIARRDGTQFRNDPQHPSLALLFGPMFGVDVANVKRFAVAKVLGAYGAGVLALGECDCSGIFFGGSGSADDLTILNGGSLYVNSPFNPGGPTGAIDQTGNSDPDLNLDNVYVVGGIDDNFDWPANTDIHEGTEPEPDPYAYLPNHDLVSIRAMPDKGTITDANEPMTYTPGYYSGGLQIPHATGQPVNLEPGDYYLDSVGYPASMTVNGGWGLVTGEGVTLHIIGDADMGINVQGNVIVDITAPDDGTYAGIAIYQKRDPTYDCTQSCQDWPNPYPLSEFNGTGDLIIDGAVYMPHNRLTLGGTGYIELTRVVADRFYIYGNGEKVINYKGDREVSLTSYLVK